MIRFKPRHTVTVMAVLLVSLFAFSSSASAAPGYVALGDSYSSGNGTNYPNLNLFCYRSTRAYPYIVASQRGFDLSFQACGGATTSNVLSSQVSSLRSTTAYVTITIGGNDIGFGDMIMSCPDAGESQTCWDAINNGSAQIDSTLPAALDKTYAEIARRSSKAKVIVLGYGIRVESLCAATTGITQAEANGLNAVADKLDAKIAERVKLAGRNFTYKSAKQPFMGHDACSPTPWINGDTGDLLNDFHPNAAGHRDGYVPLVRQVTG